MASTYSNLKIELIGTGEQTNTWGSTTNVNLGTAIEEAIAESADVTFSSANLTLTLTNSNSSQVARNLRLNLTGTSGGARTLTVPDIEKPYIINNGLADAVTIQNSTGSTVAVPAGKTMWVYSTGTGIKDVTNHATSLTLGTDLAVADGGTGASTAADARTNLGLGTIATQNSSSVTITGGSITGITDLTVADGGTGASTAAGARSNLGAAASGANSDITSLSGLTTALSVAQGGTGVTTKTGTGSVVLSADPALSGNPTATTQAAGNNTTRIATTAFVTTAVSNATSALGTMSTQNSNNVSITGGSISGITDLAIADGGTGASTAANARTNLGLGSMATQNSSSVSITGGTINSLTVTSLGTNSYGTRTVSTSSPSGGSDGDIWYKVA